MMNTKNTPPTMACLNPSASYATVSPASHVQKTMFTGDRLIQLVGGIARMIVVMYLNSIAQSKERMSS